MGQNCRNLRRQSVRGQHVEIEGRLQHCSYEKDGGKRYVTEVFEKVKLGATLLPKEDPKDTKKSKTKKSA